MKRYNWKKKPIAKNTKLQFWPNPVRMLIKQIDLLNHLDGSSQKIKSCCNNNLDEAMNQLLTFTLHGHKIEWKLQIRRNCQNSFFLIFHETQCMTHLLKFVDKMCKYEMSEATCSSVEDTQRTRFCPQTDRRTDEQGETTIHPFNFVERGYNIKRNKMDKTSENSGGALNTESQTRINYLVMDIHNWVLDDHNSIMTFHGGYSKLWISKIQRSTCIIEYP